MLLAIGEERAASSVFVPLERVLCRESSSCAASATLCAADTPFERLIPPLFTLPWAEGLEEGPFVRMRV